MNIIDSDNLKNLSYGEQVPFSVYIDNYDEPLVCAEILRIIPGTRIVCKARMKNKDVIAKFFVNHINASRHIARESHCMKTLQEAGIPTPKIIAESTVAKSITVLITEYLQDAENPCSLLKLNDPENRTREILNQFFALLAEFHKAGLVQKDLHLNNFLIKGNILYAIDAANLKKTGSPLSASAASDNIALFFAQFDKDFYPELLKAIESYHNSNPYENINQKTIIALAKTKRQLIWKKVSRKLFRNCTSVVRKSNFRHLILCKRNYYKNQFIDFLNNPDDFLQKSPLLKDGNSSTVGLVEIDGCKYAVKRYNIQNSVKFICRQFTPTRTRRCWLIGHLLIFSNIKTPEPIAIIEKRLGPIRTVGYIITEFIDAPSIRQVLSYAKDNKQEQSKILTCFISSLKKLHERKITHGDFKDTNFHYDDGELYIVDLDSVKLHKSRLMLKRAIKKDYRRLIQNYQEKKNILEIINRTLRESQ